MATSIKISQLPAKGSNLEATDLLEVSEFNGTGYVSKSITGAEIVASIPPTSIEWGDIGGVLSTQTDLQNALNGKVDTNATITGATKTKITYDSKGLVTAGADATTTDIADSLNKRYVTDAKLAVLNNTSGTNTGDQTLSGLGGVPTTRTLTINGTTQDLSADRTFTISTGITIGTTAITSGTVGRVLFEGTGNVVSESANLFWDNTNGRLGVGTSTPTVAFEVKKTIASGAIEGIKIEVNHNSSTSAATLDFIHTQFDARARIQSIAGAGGANPTLSFIIRSTTGMSILQSGNVNIGTSTTDAGYKLDVNGTARVGDTLTLGSSTTALSMFSAALTFTQSGGARFINFVNGGITFNNTYAFTIANGSNIPLTATGTDVYIGSQTNNGLFLQRNSAYVYTLNKLNGGNDVSNTFDIRTGDYTSSAFSSSSGNIRIYSGDNTGTGGGGFGNLILQHNGTVKRGNVLIGTTTNVASAIVNVDSTTQGFLPPRMTTTQKNAIASPATGLVVYDSTLNKLCVRGASAWETITSL